MHVSDSSNSMTNLDNDRCTLLPFTDARVPNARHTAELPS